MTDVTDLASGKNHTDENFPVASFLLRPEHRAPVMAYYRFARAADDISDNAQASPETKLELLAQMRAGLDGQGAPEAMALAKVMTARRIDPVHAHDLLDAFVRDVTVTRYRDWDELIGYCRLSAMPVGRYVLDVHGESRETWPANDALCAALQVINHLQDCAKDYRTIDRVYIPRDALDAAGVPVESLAAATASPALRDIISGLAERTQHLLARSAGFSRAISDRRLAVSLAARLRQRDPLSERVHHGKIEALMLAAVAALPRLVTP